MFESFKPKTDAETFILKKLRVWIAALAVVCVLTGIGIGAMLAGRPAVAQDQLQLAARGPDALSASFVEIARHVEPAVVNIDTLQATATLLRATTKKSLIARRATLSTICFVASRRGPCVESAADSSSTQRATSSRTIM